jgi:cysteine synthase A
LRTVDSILDLIGGTPLVRLSRLVPDDSAEVYVKAEYMNPSGSIKDRIALQMVRDAENQGKLRKGYTIVEASTGNTGTALAFVGKRLGYKVEIYMPEGMTRERIKLMESYGAEVHELELDKGEVEGVAGAEVEIKAREKCLEEEKNRSNVWWARQFNNPSNTEAQVKTGKEILSQMNNAVDAFVASIGVGGTLYGVAKALRSINPKVGVFGLEPASAKYPLSNGYTRVPGTSNEVCGGIIEEMMNSGMVDKIIKVTNRDAVKISDKLVREEGLFCGISSGANVFYACKLAKKLGPGKRVVTVLPDSRDRYFSEKTYTT